jgi:hypothetical protein
VVWWKFKNKNILQKPVAWIFKVEQSVALKEQYSVHEGEDRIQYIFSIRTQVKGKEKLVLFQYLSEQSI